MGLYTKLLQELIDDKKTPFDKKAVLINDYIAYGANLKAKNKADEPIIHQLVQKGFTTPVRWIIKDKKRDALNILNKNGDTLYSCLLEAKKDDPLWMKSLIFSIFPYIGTDLINSQDNDGNTLLHQLCMRHSHQYHTTEAAIDLLNLGADIYIENNKGFTPFQCMLNTAIDFEKQSLYSHSPYGVMDYIRVLEFGADPDSVASDGKTTFGTLKSLQGYNRSTVISHYRAERAKVTLSLLGSKEKIYLPKLQNDPVPYLLSILDKLDDKNIEKLGKYARVKEAIISHIENDCNEDERSKLLEQALEPGTNLNKLFAVQRGLFATRQNSGSFAKLHAIQNSTFNKYPRFFSAPVSNANASEEASKSEETNGPNKTNP